MAGNKEKGQVDSSFMAEEFVDLTKLDITKCTGTLALASYVEGKRDKPLFRSLNISEEVAREFSEMAMAFVGSYATSEALKFYEFSGDFRPSHQEVEVLDVQESLLETAVKQIPASIDLDLLDVQQDDLFVDDIRFYVFILEFSGDRVVFFRRYHRNKELKRSKNLFLRLVGEQFVMLDSPTFQFDEKFDAVLYHMRLFSFNKANFQYIFNYYELLRKKAEEYLDEIEAVVPIENFSDFKKACLGHQAKLEKLRNIARKQYWSRINMTDIKRTIDEFELDIVVKQESGQEMLVYESANQWALLNLLDDAYLNSHMTRNKYEVTSKQLWKKPDRVEHPKEKVEQPTSVTISQ